MNTIVFVVDREAEGLKVLFTDGRWVLVFATAVFKIQMKMKKQQ